MPEDVPFNCRVCCGNLPSTWELMVRQEMNNCMLNVMDGVMASKCVKQLRPIVKRVSVHTKLYIPYNLFVMFVVLLYLYLNFIIIMHLM